MELSGGNVGVGSSVGGGGGSGSTDGVGVGLSDGVGSTSLDSPPELGSSEESGGSSDGVGVKDGVTDGVTEGVTLGSIDGVIAVSYTHLDVYKRQLILRTSSDCFGIATLKSPPQAW